VPVPEVPVLLMIAEKEVGIPAIVVAGAVAPAVRSNVSGTLKVVKLRVSEYPLPALFVP